MPNPWVSLRCDQLIPVNKVVNEIELLEKGWRRRREKTASSGCWSPDLFCWCSKLVFFSK
jgi:hypothetical protein